MFKVYFCNWKTKIFLFLNIFLIDIYNIGDEYDGDEEIRPEFMCPFCAEDYDVVGLCCHIDEEHTIEAKNGVYFASQDVILNYYCAFAFRYYKYIWGF